MYLSQRRRSFLSILSNQLRSKGGSNANSTSFETIMKREMLLLGLLFLFLSSASELRGGALSFRGVVRRRRCLLAIACAMVWCGSGEIAREIVL